MEPSGRWLARIARAPLVAFDTETTGLDPMTRAAGGHVACAEPGGRAYMPLAHHYAGAPEAARAWRRALALLQPWLEDAAQAKVGQNLKYDAHIFANHGIQLARRAARHAAASPTCWNRTTP